MPVGIDGKAVCPYCGKLVMVEWRFLMTHKENESSADCYGSGIYVERVIGSSDKENHER